MGKQNSLKAIEDFLIIHPDKLRRSPLLIIFGCSDLKVSNVAADIFCRGYCKYILISGGLNRRNGFIEAEYHRDNLVDLGVPEDNILIEDKAQNTLENVLFSKLIIKKHFKKFPQRIIVVCQCFHGRRVLMTLKKFFPKKVEYILQPVETKGHRVKNWWKNPQQRRHIIEEIKKIGEYILKGDIGYQ